MVPREPRTPPPAFESYSDLPLFNTKAVVHHTGVPAPTLRAWERRYGILAPRRGDNAYRLYSERDMATVDWLRERVERGMTISQAIALLRSLDPGCARPRRGCMPTRAASLGLAPPDRVAEPAGVVTSPPGCALDELCGALLAHCARLDEEAVNRLLAQAFALFTVEEVCLQLLTPALVALGQGWAEGQVSVATEHFASALVRAQLESLFRSLPCIAGGPLALVGCAPGEQHELGALMLALCLRRQGQRVVYLAQSVEPESLVATVLVARPACVVLSASLRAAAEALASVGRRLRALGSRRVPLLFGGQAFAMLPELAERVPGEHLALTAAEAAREIHRRFAA